MSAVRLPEAAVHGRQMTRAMAARLHAVTEREIELRAVGWVGSSVHGVMTSAAAKLHVNQSLRKSQENRFTNF